MNARNEERTPGVRRSKSVAHQGEAAMQELSVDFFDLLNTCTTENPVRSPSND